MRRTLPTCTPYYMHTGYHLRFGGTDYIGLILIAQPMNPFSGPFKPVLKVILMPPSADPVGLAPRHTAKSGPRLNPLVSILLILVCVVALVLNLSPCRIAPQPLARGPLGEIAGALTRPRKLAASIAAAPATPATCTASCPPALPVAIARMPTWVMKVMEELPSYCPYLNPRWQRAP